MKKSLRNIVLILPAVMFHAAGAQRAGTAGTRGRIATIEVTPQHAEAGLAVPVHINLDAVTLLPDSVLQLVEVAGKTAAPVAFQVEAGQQRHLHWIMEPQAGKKTALFELRKGAPQSSQPQMKAVAADGFLTISSGAQNLLRYNYATSYPPPGVDTVFRRSGFIHPLWSPGGQALTRIHAPDHYHHWGLWNPWTQVLFEKDTVDFWNLYKAQGTVRFARFLAVTDGPVFARYNALHEHVVFKKSGQQKVALNEVQSVRIYRPAAGAGYYIADISIHLACASESPVLLLTYRYGGLGIRATEAWNKTNSRIITSEGKDRKEADGSKARWCMVQGAAGTGAAGLVMMSYPTNYNHPEPLRVWPEDTNGRGDVFLNFSPTKDRDWLLEPGKTYGLRYRFMVFDNTCSAEKAEAAWQHFAQGPAIRVTVNKR